MTDDMRASDLAEMIERCDSILGNLEDLGSDGHDGGIPYASEFTDNARHQVDQLREEFRRLRVVVLGSATAPPSSASVAPQPEETE